MSYLVLQEAYERLYLQWRVNGFDRDEAGEMARKQVQAIYL